MEGLHPGRAELGLGNGQAQVEPGGEGFGVAVGLGGEVARVDPDHRHGPIQAADLVQQHRRLDAEAGGEHKAGSEGLQAPTQAAGRIALGQLLADLR